MGGLNVLRGVVGGIDQATGNTQGAKQMQDAIDRYRQARQSEIRSRIVPHAMAIQGLQQKLSAIDKDKNPNEYNATVDEIQGNLHAMRDILHPDQKLGFSDWLQTHTTDRMHITNHDKRVRDLAAKNAQADAKGQAQDAEGAAALAQSAVPWNQTPDAMKEQAKETAAEQLQRLRNEGMEGRSNNSRAVPYYPGAMSLATASSLAGQGKQFDGEDGQPIDLAHLPPDSILVPVYQGTRSFWQVATDKGRYETANNQRQLQPAVGGPNPNAPSIGEARVPTQRTSVTPGPNGPVVTSSRTAPVNPVSTTPTAAVPPAAHSPAAAPVAPAHPTAHARTAPTAKSSTVSGDIPPLRDPKLPSMRGADEQRIASIAAPMAAVEQQVVGRGAKPLWEYSSVLDSPEMIKAVNLAMAAPMLQTPEGNKNISFWGTIATAMGFASAAQQATTEAITQARDKVQQQGGPEAVEFLDRLAELKGTIPNLRKIQGGSSAMGAIQPLYQESPIMNITSAEDFRNRTANMLRTMAVSLDQSPGINKKHVDWLYKQADAAQGKKSPEGQGTQKLRNIQKSGADDPVDKFLRSF